MTESIESLRNRYPDCAVEGCGVAAGGYSRFCHKHRTQYYDTRSPTGRILRRCRDLKPYRQMVDPYLRRHRDHPAIVRATAWLDRLLLDAQNDHEGKGRLTKELQRLFRDGATGVVMLARVAAVAGYGYFNARTWPDDAVHTVNLGHAALSATPRPIVTSASGKKRNHKVPGLVCLEMGQLIREVLGILLAQLWTAIDRKITARARAREGLNKLLQSDPLP